MEIKTFDISYLNEAKSLLKEVFFYENSDEYFNEWEFAENILKSKGYIPEMCLVALEDGKVIGYNILTLANIGQTEGLALGPLGVKAGYRNSGVGSHLVKESIQRAKKAGYPWIVLMGGDYYFRFGFEKGQIFNITATDNDFDNAHIKILFLDDSSSANPYGKLAYCDAFYDSQGNLL